ncbi:TIGR03086 family metal-binding protein [Arthrobacter sp. H14-L1]|uniref:TIGR03086 family metal-binding protein n=1 Tax=Arthrobacter sp. H14-L1 TaxID=2996697 RepID=UPI002271E6F0|nr:TIGR03086 family metal-binding protein [Arthrobacter sp. H14-L1]MCY0903550.1 TIGR03086 family metal-binding protein [Arthrobacter sp. H14-L1]
MSRSPVEQLASSLADISELVEGIRDNQWDLPTPCTQWSVYELVSHLSAGNQLFAYALAGDPAVAAPSAAPLAADLPPGQRAAAHRDSVTALLAAFNSPGALERVVVVPFGSVPGLIALHLRLVEALVHGWDLAHAVGVRPPFDQELAEQELAFTEMRLADVPPERSPFGPPRPVAQDASALDRLAACLGRDVTAFVADGR